MIRFSMRSVCNPFDVRKNNRGLIKEAQSDHGDSRVLQLFQDPDGMLCIKENSWCFQQTNHRVSYSRIFYVYSQIEERAECDRCDRCVVKCLNQWTNRARVSIATEHCSRG